MLPERIEEIRQEYLKRQEELQRKRRHPQSLEQVFGLSNSGDEDADSCLICHL